MYFKLQFINLRIFALLVIFCLPHLWLQTRISRGLIWYKFAAPLSQRPLINTSRLAIYAETIKCSVAQPPQLLRLSNKTLSAFANHTLGAPSGVSISNSFLLIDSLSSGINKRSVLYPSYRSQDKCRACHNQLCDTIFTSAASAQCSSYSHQRRQSPLPWL